MPCFRNLYSAAGTGAIITHTSDV